MVGKPHPNIYEITDVFKREDAGSWSTAGPKTKTNEAKGENLFAQFNSETISE